MQRTIVPHHQSQVFLDIDQLASHGHVNSIAMLREFWPQVLDQAALLRDYGLFYKGVADFSKRQNLPVLIADLARSARSRANYYRAHPNGRPVLSIEEVKETLPDVKISIDGQIYPAFVCGRKNQFPTVCAYKKNYEAEFSWEAVTRAANDPHVILIG